MVGNIIIEKKYLSDTDLEKIKNSLTLKNLEYEAKLRYSSFGTGRTLEYIEYFIEYKDEIIIPRNTLSKLNIKVLYSYNIQKGKESKITFLKSLRDYQKVFLEKQEKIHTTDLDDRIWEAGCGSGKTILALWYLEQVGRKTIIFVPTNYLIRQWNKRINEFTDGQPLVLSNKITTEQVEEANVYLITLDMYLSLGKGLKKLLLSEIGCVVVDEGHRLGAESYHPIISEIPAQYRLCLTATFRRPDGREQLLLQHFGKVYKMENPLPPAKFYFYETGCKVRNILVKDKLTNMEGVLSWFDENGYTYRETKTYISWDRPKTGVGFKKLISVKDSLEYSKLSKKDQRVILESHEKVHQAQIDNFVVEDSHRVKLFLTTIKKCLDSGRVVLVLSKRKDILKSFYRLFKDTYNTALIISETNKISDEEFERVAEECQLILGIAQLAQEGLDIDRLDTVVLLHPVIDTEQLAGRPSRLREGKKEPLVLYPKDDIYTYTSIQKKAMPYISLNSVFYGTTSLTKLSEIL